MSKPLAVPSTDPDARGYDRSRRRAVEALAALLERGDEADRCHTCRTLGAIGATECVTALTAHLRDEDVDVCVDAATALGRLGDAAAVPALLDSLANDPDGDVKTAVVEALGQLGGPQVHAALLEIAVGRPEDMTFDDSDSWDAWWDMQLAAVEALGRTGDSRAAPALDAILDDEDGQDIESSVLRALAGLGRDGEERLARRLAARDPRMRRRAATALGHARSDSAAAHLGQTLLDPVAEVRAAAVEALGSAGAARYLPAILTLHRDPNSQVRAAAARVAAQLAGEGDARALPVAELGALISDPDTEVRAGALAALARVPEIPGELRAAAETALRDGDEACALAACEVVARFADPAACALLLEVLSDPRRPPRLRGAAARLAGATATDPGEAPEALTRAVDDAEPSVRLAALSALMELGTRAEPASAGDDPDAGSTPPRTPRAVVIAALAGTLPAPPEDAAEIPVETAGSGPDSADAERPAAAALSEAERGGEAGITRAPPASTLEAIALRNAEIALGVPGTDDAPHADAPTDADAADLDDYMEIVESNERTAEWLFARGSGPIRTDVRRLAARVVGGARFEAALPALIEALGDEDAELRTEAAASIALIAAGNIARALDGEAAAALEAACKDPDRNLRAAAARALGALGTGAAALVALLADADPAVRIQAARAVAAVGGGRAGASGIGPGEAVDALLPTLADPVPGVRKAGLAGLAGLLESAGATIDPARRSGALERIVDTGFAGDGSQARDVARALGQIDPAAAADAVVRRLEALPTSAERRVAIEILEELYSA